MKMTATCTNCGTTMNKDRMTKIEKNNRGGRSAFICERCRTRMLGYTYENDTRHGCATVHPFTYGIELETSCSNAKVRSELNDYGFIPTSDCTVDVEYKSPIFNNLKSMSHLVKVIDKMIDNNDIEIGSNCGTHFHVGHTNLNRETMGYIRRFYNSLFVPLCETMQAHETETATFFGRYFGRWCNTITMDTYAEEHTNFINVQHSNTLEFRIAFYRNGKQYMNVAKFATKVTEIVMNNFVNNFNNEAFDRTRYRNITEYRKHKANVAAQKIVKAYLKAIETM